MAKQEANPVQKAQADLDKARRDYEKLIKKPSGNMSVQQRDEHTAACRKALAAKRYAQAVLEAVSFGRPAPQPADAVETKRLADKDVQ